MSIITKNISKNFGKNTILENINIEVKSGEIVALLGPSGSGKTTLLRIIAGLEFPDKGEIIINDESMNEKNVNERNIGFVFQHYALFKHMSVFENVAFGLKIRPKETRPSKDEIKNRVMELLRLVHLGDFANHFPSQLSGGQRQRIALARALAVEPKLLLLDEPFGALDVKVRRDLRKWIRNLHDQVGLTSIFVTHDQEEAMEVADRIVIIKNGHVEQVGTPAEIYKKPISPFIFDFVGESNEIDAFIDEGGCANIFGRKLHDIKSDSIGKRVKICFRPNDVNVVQNFENFHIEAVINRVNLAGPHVKIEITANDGGKNEKAINIEIANDEFDEKGYKNGDKIFIRIRDVKIYA